MTIAGLPLHFLVIHFAVVFTPLATLAVIAFAVLPSWRWLTRWTAATLTVISTVCVFVARLSGRSYLSSRPELLQIPGVATHQSRGNLLLWLVLGFLVVTLVGVWSLGGSTALASGKGAWESKLPALEKVLPVVLVIASLIVLVWVILTGDAGARAVWGIH
jgi:hypothetical protein